MVSPDVVYSLTFITGRRFGANVYGNSSVSLWAGSNFLAARFPNPVEGTLVPGSLSYTSPPAGSVIGLPLRIELLAAGESSQPWFDNFRLFTADAPCTSHRATATAQLFNGVFVGATITDPGCGYTNAPTVSIEGGGGTGALATAIVTNGRVASIRVDNGGCCYTNVPQIIIGPPPFLPTVEIRVSRVIVTQHLMAGRRYVLESTFDFVTWMATGPSFIAPSDTVETELDVNVVGRFYRIREVP